MNNQVQDQSAQEQGTPEQHVQEAQKDMQIDGVANPLLVYAQAQDDRVVPFDAITSDQFLPALESAFIEARQAIAAIVANTETPTIENTIVAFEYAPRTVNRIMAVYETLKESHGTPDIVALSEKVMSEVSAFSSELYLNAELFANIKKVYDTEYGVDGAVNNNFSDAHGQNTDNQNNNQGEDMRLLERTYTAFVRQGALLGEKEKITLQALDQDIARLTTLFGNQLQHSVNAFREVIRDKTQLAGLPEHAIVAAKEEAVHQDMPEAWVFTLHAPSVMPVLQYADSPELRKALWMAMNKEGMGPGNMSDNRPVIRELVHARHKRAVLLGYTSHAEYVLADRMAQNISQVQAMFDSLTNKALPQAKEELALIAKKKGQELLPWDIAYYAEKIRKEAIDFDPETLRPYFAQSTVMNGMFAVAEKMFGISAQKNTTDPTYHPDVVAYDFYNAEKRHLGMVYFDLFPRSTKRQGGWAHIIRPKEKDIPVAVSISCNLSRPTAESEALFSHNDVVILFHEFGHAMHCLFSTVQYASLACFNVVWDFCELPSQFFDKCASDADILKTFAVHHSTGKIIPEELCKKITAEQTCMNAGQVLGQVRLASLDMAWYDGRGNEATHHKDDQSVVDFEYAAIVKYQLFEPIAGTARSTWFRHIFCGSYDMGYYSYHWADVLAVDTYMYFKEHGFFDHAITHAFRDIILAKGNTEDAMTLYRRFRGQEPDPTLLLKSKGIV